jgi:hypothetical protein
MITPLSPHSFGASALKPGSYAGKALRNKAFLTCGESNSFVLAQELQPWR